MRRLDELLARASCRALVVLANSSRDPFLAPFVGPARLGASFLIAPAGAASRLGFLSPMDREEAAGSGLAPLTPEALDIERWNRDGASPPELLAGVLSRGLHLCELAPGRLALAGWVGAGVAHEFCELLAAEGWSFTAGEPIVGWLRKRKTPEQLEAIRHAATGTMAAFSRVAELLAASRQRADELWLGGERLRVRRLRREVAGVLAAHGLEQPDGNIIAPGGAGAVPHTSGLDDRVLAPAESLVVDLFPRGRLFADCTRTFCVGEAPEPLARAHALVVEASRLARDRARPGMRGWDLQKSVCELLGEAGYPTPISDRGTTRGYVHGLGHGIGFELHEYPSFKQEAGEEGVLESGDVVTLEPGLYDPEAGWGVRIEDVFALNDDGLEHLTPLPDALDPRAW